MFSFVASSESKEERSAEALKHPKSALISTATLRFIYRHSIDINQCTQNDQSISSKNQNLSMSFSERLNFFNAKIILITMQKIEFKVEFISITYKINTKKSFTIRLTTQTQDGSQIRSEEVAIPSDESIIKLNSITPFKYFFIVNEDRAYHHPYNIYFILDRTPIIRRRIPLHLSKIQDHYSNHQLQKEVPPLEQIYAFEQGKIIYSIRDIKSSTVTNQEEIEDYEQRLSQFSSLNSSRILKESITLSNVKKGSNIIKREVKRPSYSIEHDLERQSDDKLEAQETLDIDDPQCSQKGEKNDQNYLQSWRQFSMMEQQHKQANQQKQVQVKKQNHPNGYALKLIVILIAIGFLILAFDAYRGPQLKIKGAKVKQAKKGDNLEDKKANKKQKIKKS